jgi:hypothetical protein
LVKFIKKYLKIKKGGNCGLAGKAFPACLACPLCPVPFDKNE